MNPTQSDPNFIEMLGSILIVVGIVTAINSLWLWAIPTTVAGVTLISLLWIRDWRSSRKGSKL